MVSDDVNLHPYTKGDRIHDATTKLYELQAQVADQSADLVGGGGAS